MNKKLWLTLTLAVDAVLINGGIILSFLMRYGGLPSYNFDPYVRMAVWITLIQLFLLYAFSCYDPREMSQYWSVFANILQAVTVGVAVVIVLTFVLRSFSFPRLIFVITWAVQVVLLTAWRFLELKLAPPRFEDVPVLVVGTGETARQLVEEISRHQRYGYRVVGAVERDYESAGGELAGVEMLGLVTDVPDIVASHGVKYVIITIPIRERQLIEDLIKIRSAQIRVDVVPELYEIMVARIDEIGIGDIPLVSLVKPPVSGYQRILKTVVETAAALFFLLALLPVWLIVAAAVKLSSRGPVLYRQARVGRNGREFMMYKYRTMIRDAEEATGPVLSGHGDERVTPLGRFLRRSRLDEVPQLLNIVAGQMSFVGPRPERPEFVRVFAEEIVGYSERFAVKPGLTGLAQVSGRYATTTENKLKFDLLYIQNQSFLLDLKILIKTLYAILAGQGSSLGEE